jgi:hypothetical protein
MASRLSVSEKVSRQDICSPLFNIRNSNVSVQLKKRPIRSNPCKKTSCSISHINNEDSLPTFNLADFYSECSILQHSLNEFIKNRNTVLNLQEKFVTELKFYIKIIKRLSQVCQPHNTIFETIATGLQEYANVSIFISNPELKQINDSLKDKLNKLSSENIEFYKKIQELQKEMTLVKKSMAYHEKSYVVESLLKEIAVKSDYISKCNNEINEYKAREVELMKKIETRVNTPIPKEFSIDFSSKRDYFRRSQTIKSIPKLSFITDSINTGQNKIEDKAIA